MVHKGEGGQYVQKTVHVVYGWPLILVTDEPKYLSYFIVALERVSKSQKRECYVIC